MFCYRLPDGGLHTHTYLNAEGQIKFDPPVYEQRYTTAVRILEDERWGRQFKKVVDFGCAEMRLLSLLRRVEFIEHIMEVDIDGDLLRYNQLKAEPLVSDYLQKREIPLRIELFKGSIDASVEQLRNVDAVIALEIIEHLYPKTLENVPENIFGFMKPKIAIFSTPNSEFNVLFEPLLANGFRHLDHKFEWTRSEFKKWALNICQRYPNYGVAIMGVGDSLPEKKKIGHVTQIAIFVRNDLLNRSLVESLDAKISANIITDKNSEYEEIFSVDFPFKRDERSKEEKLWDEVRYQMDRCRRVERYFNRELCIYQIPLTVLTEYTKRIGATMDDLLAILKENNVEVKGDFIVLPEYDEDDLSYRHYDDCFDDEYGWESAAADAENDEELGACGYTPYQNGPSYDSDENWD